MSAFATYSVPILRRKRDTTPTGGKPAFAEIEISGSPFADCRLYISRKEKSIGRTEGPAGATTLQEFRLSIPLQRAGIIPPKINDIVLLPASAIPGELRARIERVRVYETGWQCDLEVGAVAEQKN